MPELTDLLSEWLPQQRWFASKGRTIAKLSLREMATLADEPRRLVVFLADISYTDSFRESYQLPLVFSDDRPSQLEYALIGEADDVGAVYDGPQDKEVTCAWLRHIADRATVGPITFDRDSDEPHLDVDAASRVVGVEQSNTSVVYGEELILKLFRKIAPGLNPDLEITRALAAAGATVIAPPYGWAELALDNGESATLALLQPFLRTATDGWALATTSVRDLYAEADLHADEVGGDFAAESDRLGAATAEVHELLARALPSRPAQPDEVAETVKAMHERLDAALEVVPELAAYADAMRSSYDAVTSTPDPGTVQRIHGDLHLGQALRTETSWVILDFEGEPARPLAERTRLMSPLRDIAGMLRSFSYAARHLLADHAHNPALEYRAVEWAERNRGAFCDGYARTAGHDPREAAVLLRAFELDKAVYEAVYEARNRPSWLPIPMTSIERLVTS